jgi:hypothetical protein
LLNRDASPELIDLAQHIEDQSDKWSDNLAISNFAHDVAVWGVLTQLVGLIEAAAEKHGFASQRHREYMINLSRSGTLLLDFLRKANLPNTPILLRWTAALADSTKQAVWAAHNYEIFVSSFRLWHKDHISAEVLSGDSVRFTAFDSPMQRRVRAYQQGVRITGWPATADQPSETSLVDDAAVKELINKLWGRTTLEGALAMRYPDDSELLSVLRDIYVARTEALFRRNPLLELGGYTLEMFRKFFAALMSVCSVHEYLCFAWYKAHQRYPFESAVLVKTSADWIELLAGLSSLQKDTVGTMIGDLTFGAIRPLEIYIHPFVPTADGNTLYLVPHFILNSRAEENILRVCSYARPDLYSSIANAKENEMREKMRESIPTRYVLKGPIKQPHASLPDIDTLIEDSIGSAVIVGELKWVRKTVRVLEHIDRDAELEEGFQQLKELRQFLNDNPTYLNERGIIADLSSRAPISYALVARDHMAWIDPDYDVWLSEFDAVIWALQNSDSLAEAIRKLRKYEWLPTEGIDFVVRFERASVATVAIEVEIFHRPPSS